MSVRLNRFTHAALMGCVLFSLQVFPMATWLVGESAVRHLWSLPVAPYGRASLQDITKQGQLLLLSPSPQAGPAGTSFPTVLLWSPGERKPSTEIPLGEFSRYASSLPRKLADAPVGPLKVVPGSGLILAVQLPWLVAIDAQSHREAGRMLPCDDDARRPGDFPAPLGEAPADRLLIPAINPATGAVAIACNVGQQPSIVLVDSNLHSTLNHWKVPRPVQDIVWSPGGDSLAVLWYMPPNPFYSAGKFNRSQVNSPPIEPNIAIFDPKRGKEVTEFSTGEFDAQITFTADGAVIYSINHAKYLGYSRDDWAKENLRVFDAKTGALMRTIKVPDTGVRNNFCLSPNGKLIAAESTVDAHLPWFIEQVSLSVEAGFVLLDTQTGRVLFRDKRRTLGDARERLPLFFSPDNAEVFANFNPRDGQSDGTIDGYSIF
jgi:hypothetical protein